ncbi:hypothetical protein EN35_20415 [Rhodococcus qingshengii]|nr:hypothetical protein EN35_20415 [Rhodococcus qingshengii]
MRKMAERVWALHAHVSPQIDAVAGKLGEIARQVTERYGETSRELSKAMIAFDERSRELSEQISAAVSASVDVSGLSKIAEFAAATLRRAYPPNWPTDIGLDLDKLVEIAQVDGIAIFYVPRAAIVTDLVNATDTEARMTIVEQRRDEIAADCLRALPKLGHEEIGDGAVLTRSAVDASLAGHHEAAQALAVVVCDSYLKKFLDKGYTRMRQDLTVEFTEDEVLRTLLGFTLPLATAVPFLVDWRGEKKDGPAPLTFSRHATIHGASTSQLNPLNATLAIMLAVTLTCAWDFSLRATRGRGEVSV